MDSTTGVHSTCRVLICTWGCTFWYIWGGLDTKQIWCWVCCFKCKSISFLFCVHCLQQQWFSKTHVHRSSRHVRVGLHAPSFRVFRTSCQCWVKWWVGAKDSTWRKRWWCVIDSSATRLIHQLLPRVWPTLCNPIRLNPVEKEVWDWFLRGRLGSSSTTHQSGWIVGLRKTPGL